MCFFHFLCLFFPFEQMLLSLGKVPLHKVNSKTLGLLLLIYALIVFCKKSYGLFLPVNVPLAQLILKVEESAGDS